MLRPLRRATTSCCIRVLSRLPSGLMGYLNRGSSARLVLGPGETFELPVTMELLGKDFSIVRPGEDTDAPAYRPGGTRRRTRCRALPRHRCWPGSYRIFIGQDNHPSAVFAVQMDPTESDLRQAPPRGNRSAGQGPDAIPRRTIHRLAPRMQVEGILDCPALAGRLLALPKPRWLIA